MEEIKRVLRPDGVLLISTPDRYEYSDLPRYHNQFHVKELYRHEFEALLKLRFRHIALFGQRVAYGSYLAPLSETQRTHHGTFRGDPRRITCGCEGYARICCPPAVHEARHFPRFFAASSEPLRRPQHSRPEFSAAMWVRVHLELQRLMRLLHVLVREHFKRRKCQKDCSIARGREVEPLGDRFRFQEGAGRLA
jgi:SAM-dependent methyltransferase